MDVFTKRGSFAVALHFGPANGKDISNGPTHFGHQNIHFGLFGSGRGHEIDHLPTFARLGRGQPQWTDAFFSG
jgi:hypothetical protein